VAWPHLFHFLTGPAPGATLNKIVIPAQAGIQGFNFAGRCFLQKRFP
jgi:hypothetical protein